MIRPNSDRVSSDVPACCLLLEFLVFILRDLCGGLLLGLRCNFDVSFAFGLSFLLALTVLLLFVFFLVFVLVVLRLCKTCTKARVDAIDISVHLGHAELLIDSVLVRNCEASAELPHADSILSNWTSIDNPSVAAEVSPLPHKNRVPRSSANDQVLGSISFELIHDA